MVRQITEVSYRKGIFNRQNVVDMVELKESKPVLPIPFKERKRQTEEDINNSNTGLVLVLIVVIVLSLAGMVAASWLTQNMVENGNDIVGHPMVTYTYSLPDSTGIWIARTYLPIFFNVGFTYSSMFAVSAFGAFLSCLDLYLDRNGKGFMGYADLFTNHIHFARNMLFGIIWAMLWLCVSWSLGLQSLVSMIAGFGIQFYALTSFAPMEEIYENSNLLNRKPSYDQMISYLNMWMSSGLAFVPISMIYILVTAQPLLVGFGGPYWALFSVFSLGLIVLVLPFLLRPWLNVKGLELSPVMNDLWNRLWLLVILAVCFGMSAIMAQFKVTSVAVKTFGVVL